MRLLTADLAPVRRGIQLRLDTPELFIEQPLGGLWHLLHRLALLRGLRVNMGCGESRFNASAALGQKRQNGTEAQRGRWRTCECSVCDALPRRMPSLTYATCSGATTLCSKTAPPGRHDGLGLGAGESSMGVNRLCNFCCSSRGMVVGGAPLEDTKAMILHHLHHPARLVQARHRGDAAASRGKGRPATLAGTPSVAPTRKFRTFFYKKKVAAALARELTELSPLQHCMRSERVGPRSLL